MNIKTQAGITLVELLVGMVVGLIVIGGVTVVYIATVKSSGETLKASRLNQEMGAAMEIMVNDIRRAGFWAGVNSTNVLANPFNDASANMTLLTVRDASSNVSAGSQGSGNCVTYTYDADVDTAGPVDGDSMEFFGFKLDGDVLRMRTSCAGCAATAVANCTSGAGGTWDSVTDNNVITVTSLTFDLGNSKCINMTQNSQDCYATAPGTDDITLEIREVAIGLQAELVSDSSVDASVNQTVRVRNDLLRQY